MALIKSNNLIQTGTAVVAGDQITAGDLTPPTAVPVPGTNLVIERVVPETPAPEYQEAPAGYAEQAPEEGADDQEAYEQPYEQPYEPAYEQPAEEAAYEAPVPEETPEEGITPGSMFDAFDAERDALLEQAQAQAEMAAQEATGHLGAPDASLELEEAAGAIRASYPDDSPAHQAAMESVTPFIEQQAASALESVAIQAANDARWRELATAEEQVASLVDNFARRVMVDPPAEMAIHSLLAERESLMAEARLKATRMIQEAEERSAQLVHEGQAQAARSILEVESRREQILAELRQQGYAEGYQEGRSQADEEGAKILQEAMESLNKLAGLVRVEAKKNEEKILQLALGIAEKIIMDEVATRPDMVLRTMEEALTKVSDLEEVTVKVNPEDLPAIQEREEYFRERLKNVRKVDFQASPKIQRGGVLIDTASGSVDAQIKTQLSIIQEAFDRVRAEYAEEPLDMTGSG